MRKCERERGQSKERRAKGKGGRGKSKGRRAKGEGRRDCGLGIGDCGLGELWIRTPGRCGAVASQPFDRRAPPQARSSMARRRDLKIVISSDVLRPGFSPFRTSPISPTNAPT